MNAVEDLEKVAKSHKNDLLTMSKITFYEIIRKCENFTGKKYFIFDYKKVELALNSFGLYTASSLVDYYETMLIENKTQTEIDHNLDERIKPKIKALKEFDDGVMFRKNENGFFKLLMGWEDFKNVLFPSNQFQDNDQCDDFGQGEIMNEQQEDSLKNLLKDWSSQFLCLSIKHDVETPSMNDTQVMEENWAVSDDSDLFNFIKDNIGDVFELKDIFHGNEISDLRLMSAIEMYGQNHCIENIGLDFQDFNIY